MTGPPPAAGRWEQGPALADTRETSKPMMIAITIIIRSNNSNNSSGGNPGGSYGAGGGQGGYELQY